MALRRRDRALSDEQRLTDLSQALGYPDLDSLLIAIAEHRVRADVVVDQLIASVDAQLDMGGQSAPLPRVSEESTSLTG